MKYQKFSDFNHEHFLIFQNFIDFRNKIWEFRSWKQNDMCLRLKMNLGNESEVIKEWWRNIFSEHGETSGTKSYRKSYILKMINTTCWLEWKSTFGGKFVIFLWLITFVSAVFSSEEVNWSLIFSIIKVSGGSLCYYSFRSRDPCCFSDYQI